MHYSEKDESVVQEVFFPSSPVRVCGNIPDIYISRMGEAWGSGHYQTTFLTPYYWGMLALKGEGLAVLGEREIHMRSGDLLLVKPEEECRFEEKSTSPFSYLWFDISGQHCNALLREVEDKKELYFAGGGRRLETPLRELSRVFRDESFSVASPISCAWTILEHINDLSRVAVGKDQDIAYGCRVIMDKRFSSNLSVNEIAQGFGVNRATLYRHFIQRYALSPKEYLVDVRVAQACKFLRTTDLPLKEIAGECGFLSLQQFYQAFRKKMGDSPGRYRREL